MRTPWQFDPPRATLHADSLVAQLDVAAPDQGLGNLSYAGQPLPPLRLMAPQLGQGERPPLLESYVRGRDLIATFGETAARPFRWQVYWRAARERYPRSLLALETVISVQTHLLESEPRMELVSEVPAGKVSRWLGSGEQVESTIPLEVDARDGLGCFAFELPQNRLPCRYVEIVHPTDFESTLLEPIAANGKSASRSIRMRHRLFAQRLEKGVILRCRVLGLLLPMDECLAEVVEHYRTFVEEELPLTA